MAGRSHRRAAPGESECPAPGCARPAGFATATPGEGPCLRHGGRGVGKPPEAVAAARLGVLRLLLASCARQGVEFEQAWSIAELVALHMLDGAALEQTLERLREVKQQLAEAYVPRG